MAKLLKLRRGTTSQHSSFTGAEGEVTVDTTKDTIVVHDGSTAGGHPLAKEGSASTTITVADESTDTSCNVLFTTAATGDLAPKSGTNLTFNSNTGALTATSFVGDVTGTASNNAVLTGSTNNQIVTVTGANAIQGETKLTFDGSTLDFAINNSSQGLKIGATGNHIPIFTFDANRTTADDNLGQTLYKWNGTEVARVAALAGADTTNKDDGQLVLYTRASGSSLAAALTLTTSQNATFAGAINTSDSKNINLGNGGDLKFRSNGSKGIMEGSLSQVATAMGALELNLNTSNYFTKTISGNSTFTFANPAPSGTVTAFTLELTHSSGTVTWPSEVKWNEDTAPTLTTGKTHLFMFVTDDGGSRYRGAALVDYVN